jgi:hypothetical protein
LNYSLRLRFVCLLVNPFTILHALCLSFIVICCITIAVSASRTMRAATRPRAQAASIAGSSLQQHCTAAATAV